MGTEENIVEAQDRRHFEDGATPKIGRRFGPSSFPNNSLAVVCSVNNANMAWSDLVEHPGEDEEGLGRPGPHRGRRAGTMEYEEHALAALDGLFNSNEKPILAKRTISKYRRIVGNFLLWVITQKEKRRGKER